MVGEVVRKGWRKKGTREKVKDEGESEVEAENGGAPKEVGEEASAGEERQVEEVSRDEKEETSREEEKARMTMGEEEESEVEREREKKEEIQVVKKEEPITIRHPDGNYYAVRTSLESSRKPFLLNNRLKMEDVREGSFMVPGDMRVLRNHNRCDLEHTRNVSMSFNPGTGKYNTCLAGEHNAWESKEKGAICIVLTDQHFPANLPAEGKGECLRVIRVENGSINKLADELIKSAPLSGLKAGSVVMLGSASQLAVDSAEFYAAEWKRCRNWIHAELGEVIVIPAIFLSASGIEDSAVIRCLLYLNAWFVRLPEPELRFIRNTRKAWEETYLGRRERGPGWADPRLNIRLPVSLKEGAGTYPCASGGWGNRPRKIIPLNEAGERFWCTKLIGELNRELSLGLDMSVSVGRTLASVQGRADQVQIGRIIVIGASNAGKTATALRQGGVSVLPITKSGWVASKDNVEAVMVEVECEKRDQDVFLIQCMENGTFYLLNEETGNMALPEKTENGAFHATGKVCVAKEVQLEMLLGRLEPLLRKWPETVKILVTPLPRFMEDCCEKHGRKEEDKVKDGGRQLKELWELQRGIKTFLISKKLKNVLMLDPLAVLEVGGDLGKVRAAMADNFHLKAENAKLLAAKAKELIKDWQAGGKRGGEALDGALAKKPRLENAGRMSGNERGGGGAGAARGRRGGMGPPPRAGRK